MNGVKNYKVYGIKTLEPFACNLLYSCRNRDEAQRKANDLKEDYPFVIYVTHASRREYTCEEVKAIYAKFSHTQILTK